MKLVINLPEAIYKDIRDNYEGNEVILIAVKYGEPQTHGEWIKKGVSFAYEDLECSECADCVTHDADDDLPNFCPNCGASMQASYRQVTGK